MIGNTLPASFLHVRAELHVMCHFMIIFTVIFVLFYKLQPLGYQWKWKTSLGIRVERLLNSFFLCCFPTKIAPSHAVSTHGSFRSSSPPTLISPIKWSFGIYAKDAGQPVFKGTGEVSVNKNKLTTLSTIATMKS